MNSYSYMLHESLKNLARVKSLTVAKEAGLLTEVPKESKSKPNVVGIRIEGVENYFHVKDRSVYDALVEMDAMTNGLFSKTVSKFVTAPKRILTFGVTVNPAFRFKNFIRDTIHTSFMEKSFGNIFASIRAGIDAFRQTPEFIEFASTGGAFAGAYHQRDYTRPGAKEILKLKKQVMKKKGKWSFSKLWDLYQRIGEASENANRFRVYTMKQKRGASSFEAAYDAKDLLDFHRTGSNQILSVFCQTVPFLNARIQGLYKGGRAAFSKENAVNFWLNAAILSFASMMLYLHNEDDERFRQLTDADRLQYWHFYDVPGIGNVRIPVPFEVGALFGSTPAAIAEWTRDRRTDKEMGQFAWQVISDNFRLDWPQIVKPFYAQAKNKNLFTKAPIVSEHLLKVEPHLQIKEKTTQTAKLLGRAFKPLPVPDAFKSPARIDAFVHDVAGFMGYATMETIDQFMDWTRIYPQDPAAAEPRFGQRYVDKMTGFGTFIEPKGPKHFTRQQRAFYDYKNEYDKYLASYNLLLRGRLKKERRAYRKKHKEEIKLAKILTSRQRRIQNINARIKIIVNSRKFSPKEKAAKIDALLIKRQKIFEKAITKIRQKTGEI